MNEHEIKIASIFFVVYIILNKLGWLITKWLILCLGSTNKILLNFVVFDTNKSTD